MPKQCLEKLHGGWETIRRRRGVHPSQLAGLGASLRLQPSGTPARSWAQAEIDGEQTPAVHSVEQLPAVLAAKREESG